MFRSNRWEVIKEKFTPEEEADIIAKTNAIAARAAVAVSNLSYIRHIMSLIAIAFLIIVIILMGQKQARRIR